jgi:ketosteroid isomerase-like protein
MGDDAAGLAATARTAQDLARRDFEAFNARDAEAELSLFSPDVELVDPDTRRWGRQAVADFAHAWWEAFPDARVTPERESALGPFGVVEGTFTGTHVGTLHMAAGSLAPSGRMITNHFAAVYEVEGDLIVSRRLYFDRLVLLRGPEEETHGRTP